MWKYKALFVVLVLWALPASAQVIDHTSVAQFDTLSAEQFQAATETRVMFVDRSVGWNQWQGLSVCLGVPSTLAPSFCKRNQSEVAYRVPASELVWTVGHPVPNWRYYGWPGGGILPELPVPTACSSGYWYYDLDCFIRWADAHADEWQVAMWQPSYLEVAQSGIENPVGGFFHRNQPARADVADFEAMVARHPNTIFVLATTSLSRGIGTAASESFNAQLRAYALQTGRPLLDVADIESHDPPGNSCFDNRDSVPYYQNGNLMENYPNDGVNYLAICPHYTSETNGGHLGNASAGMIRLAKSWWVLIAQIATGTPPPPPVDTEPPVVGLFSCAASGGLLTCSVPFEDNVSVSLLDVTVTARDAAGNNTTTGASVSPEE